MDDRIEKLLSGQKSVEDVNLDSESKVFLNNTTRPLPLNNISTIVDQTQQADKERQSSNIYRFYGNIKSIISNSLYNDNIKIFYEKEEDPTNNNIINTVTPLNTLFKTVLADDIVEKDGWFGYYDSEPLETQEFNQATNGVSSTETFNDNKSSLCQFIPFDPGYGRLNFVDSDGKPNYQLKVTYPAYSRDDIELVRNSSNTQAVKLSDGIGVVNVTGVTIDGRGYTVFETAINHGLQKGDFLRLYNFTASSDLGLPDREVKVFRLDRDEPNFKFIVDINPNKITNNLGQSSIKRLVNGVESSYYMRVFSAMTTEQTDYTLFPAGFAINSYGDREAAFNFIKDIDIDPDVYRDNLGRPISEIYLSITKLRDDSSGTVQSEYWSDTTNGADFWTDITPGLVTNKHESINYNIKAFNDNNHPQTYFNAITPNDTEYMGDIVEYNEDILEERTLTDVNHRFNTEYRENGYTNNYSEKARIRGVDMKEGYVYKPHYRVKIRDFASYIEDGIQTPTGYTGDLTPTVNIPDYATVSLSADTKGAVLMKWKEFLDIGIYDENDNGVDYPFDSGAHYVYLSNRFYLKRQDPPCNIEYFEETYSLPSGEEEMRKRIADPKFLQIVSVTPSSSASGSDVSTFTFGGVNIPSIDIKLRFAEYYGEYDLGDRDVPGACANIGLIAVKDIDNDC